MRYSTRRYVWGPLATLLLFLVGFPAMATSAGPIPEAVPDETREADHQALRALLADATDALNRADTEALKPYFATPFVVTFADQRTFTDVPALAEYFTNRFTGEGKDIASLKFEPKADALTHFISADVGTVYGVSENTLTMKDGRDIHFQTRWTATVVKEGEQWKMSTLHTGVDPFNNPIMTKLEGGVRTAGVSGMVMGLIVGILLMLFLRRAKSPTASAT